MDVYVLLSCERQDECVDRYGDSANAYRTIFGVYSSLDRARDEMRKAIDEDDKLVREYQTDPCDFEIERISVDCNDHHDSVCYENRIYSHVDDMEF